MKPMTSKSSDNSEVAQTWPWLASRYSRLPGWALISATISLRMTSVSQSSSSFHVEGVDLTSISTVSGAAEHVAVTMDWSQMGRMSRRGDSVKRPSISIAEMMVVVAVVALDCLVIRMARWGPATPYLVFGGPLMQIALVIGLLMMFRRRRRMEKPYPFLVGFEVGGWVGHLIYVVALPPRTLVDR